MSLVHDHSGRCFKRAASKKVTLKDVEANKEARGFEISFNMFSKKVLNLLGNIVFNFNWSAGCGLHAEGELWSWLLLKAFDCQGCLHVL